MRFLIFSLGILATIAAIRPGAIAAPEASILVGGVERTYVLHVPSPLPASPALVISFHGHYGTGAGQERLSGFDALADRYGFVVAYPDGLNRGWNDGRSGARNTADDLGFAKALIDDLARRYHVDRKRVYFNGMSNGATFSQYAACNLSEEIAAIAPVAGSMPSDDLAACHPRRAVSVLEIGGTADPILPYDGGAITLFGHGSSGTVLSFERTLQYWAANAGCTMNPVVTDLPPIAPADATSVKRSTFSGCQPGSAVTGYTIVGAGHAWPGGAQYLPRKFIGPASQQLDASRAIVEFFLAHPMR